MRILLVGLVAVSACGGPSRQNRPKPSLNTLAEQSGYLSTGRYDEVIRLCLDFASAHPDVRCDELGRTGQDRPIVALRVERKPNLPIIYIQAGIHPGEIEGKDAGFAFVRDLLAGKVAPGALDAVSLVFLPVVNPDGHERFGPNHRPNQRGPVEMGFRTNAARQNVNRDYMKADTLEMRAVLAVLRTRDPIMMIDLHCTDGAKFEHDISINTAPVAPRTDRLDEGANALRDQVMKRLTELGHLPVDFYPSFVDDENPLSGFGIGEAPPRFSHFYFAARGRLGLLVETHSWRTYPERVKSTYHTLQAVFEAAPTKAAEWRQLADDTDRADAALAGSKIALVWKNGPGKREIAFRGYEFEKRTSDLTGGVWLAYDENKPQVWNVPFYNELVPAVEIAAPRGGYIVDGGFAKPVAALLEMHGLAYVPIAGEPKLDVEAFRAKKVTYQPPFEGRTRAVIDGAWSSETRTLERGAIFVPIAQRHARLVMHLFEPALPDSLAQWGHFNASFEQKEYMEAYVVEEAARAMLAKDPTLRARLDTALAADPELAKSPSKIVHWLYMQHPAWDERVNLLPVYRTSADPRAP